MDEPSSPKKLTVAAAVADALRLRGEPQTAQQILDTIVEKGFYEFRAAKPVDVVRHELKRLCGAAKGRPEPVLDGRSNGRYFFREKNRENAAAKTQEPRQGTLQGSGLEEKVERPTIIGAIRQVMNERGKAMTVEQVYAEIVRNGLYQFKASEPVHVVRSQIRKHSLGIDFPTASETKHFKLTGRKKYCLLEKSVRQKSELSNVGLVAPPGKSVPPKASVSPHRARERSEVFVSYSHKDEHWMRRLQVHLAPLERKRLVVRWDDTKLQPGGKWRKEIAAALERARIAILLVSADFLASEFIIEDELPPLLRAVNTEGVRILPIIVSPCRFEKSELGEFQALNSPQRPLNSLQKVGYERVFLQAADTVEAALYTEG